MLYGLWTYRYVETTIYWNLARGSCPWPTPRRPQTDISQLKVTHVVACLRAIAICTQGSRTRPWRRTSATCFSVVGPNLGFVLPRLAGPLPGGVLRLVVVGSLHRARLSPRLPLSGPQHAKPCTRTAYAWHLMAAGISGNIRRACRTAVESRNTAETSLPPNWAPLEARPSSIEKRGLPDRTVIMLDDMLCRSATQPPCGLRVSRPKRA